MFSEEKTLSCKRKASELTVFIQSGVPAYGMAPPCLGWIYSPELMHIQRLVYWVTTHPIKLTINITYPRSKQLPTVPYWHLCLYTELPSGTLSPPTYSNSVTSRNSSKIALLQCPQSKASGLVGSDRTRSQIILTEPEACQQSQTHGWLRRTRIPGATMVPLCLKVVTLMPRSHSRRSVRTHYLQLMLF